jgi:hypothetical protein
MMSVAALAAEFAPPAEGPVAFRRDKLPLDADAMGVLSKQIETLARGLNPETPEDRRGAAQMLALAMALDPANARARDLLAAYQEGRHRPNAEADQLERGHARIWQTIAWLETPEAGDQGQALASCLKDVIIISDPKHPKSAELRSTGEKGAWQGWVPGIAAYKKNEIAAQMEEVDDKPVPAPTEVKPDLAETGLKLATAEVNTMLWRKIEAGNEIDWMLGAFPFKMTAQIASAEEGAVSNQGIVSDGGDKKVHHRFSVRIGSGGDHEIFNRTNRMLESLLLKTYGKMPADLRISISSKEFEASLESKRKQSITAAAAVLASSAVTGVEPTGIILGQIDETGAYKLPTGFWDQLHSLGKGQGGRLILPVDAMSYLMSLLALERPGFFMEYEVLLATDFKQLLELSAKQPEGSLASALAKFSEIRDKAGTQDVRQYIANKFVRDRMALVLQDAPFHASSKMLMIQAAGNRPTLVARSVLAAELRRAIAPIGALSVIEDFRFDTMKVAKYDEIYEACRAKVDGLIRYAEKNDRALIERTQSLVISVRTVDRAIRERGEEHLVMERANTAQRALRRMYRDVAQELAVEAGDEPAKGNP